MVGESQRATGRDRVWNSALQRALDGERMHAGEIATAADVSEDTASTVLRTMAEKGWLTTKDGWGPEKTYYRRGENLPRSLPRSIPLI